MIQNNYKVCLPFEGSLCKDYMSENVFDILLYDVIPVVYDAAEYQRILPQNSYINALDYRPSSERCVLRKTEQDSLSFPEELSTDCLDTRD